MKILYKSYQGGTSHNTAKLMGFNFLYNIMTKDPAFLFYSRDFYEGTRNMLPEERACYIDLLIYQHQNKIIPLDLKRVYMYCSGISNDTIDYVLNEKFTKIDEGYVNEKLNEVIVLREKYSKNQSINGRLGQFYKRAKTMMTDAEFYLLKTELNKHDKSDALNIVCDFLKQPLKQPFNFNQATLKALAKHLAIAIDNIYIYKKENSENLKFLCMADNQWLDTVCEKVKIPIDKILFALNDFNKHLILTGKNEDKTIKEYKEYFINWARKRKAS